MIRAFKNPFFVAGFPLVICGLTFALIGAVGNSTFSYTAPGLLIPGLVLMGYGWAKRKG